MVMARGACRRRSTEGIMSRFAGQRVAISTMVLALVLVLPHAAGAGPASSANVFGQCAHPTTLEMKIAACTDASKSTSYPWILHWVYRELARAQREHGERDQAIVSYARSLAAREDATVREEMDSLSPLTQ
jgi:hypothetical protein